VIIKYPHQEEEEDHRCDRSVQYEDRSELHLLLRLSAGTTRVDSKGSHLPRLE
jgi:hypothetical protein